MQRRKIEWLIPVLALAGCSSVEVYSPSPTADQILRPRQGYKGLTNRTCREPKPGEKSDENGKFCEVRDYLLDDKLTREMLHSFRFSCQVAGQRFGVCKDKPGLCRREFKQRCFIGICGKRKLKKETYIPITKYQYLLDAGTVCYRDGGPNDL